MTITICIGSSCHLKGSRTIIQKLEELITERQLNDKIELNGSFCMGECSNGVCENSELHLLHIIFTGVSIFIYFTFE